MFLADNLCFNLDENECAQWYNGGAEDDKGTALSLLYLSARVTTHVHIVNLH